MKAKARSPQPVSDVLQGVLRELGPGRRGTREEIELIWKRVAGAQAARHSWPRRLSRRRLLVEVENSGWMYSLSLQKAALLQGMIELVGAGKLRELSFRMGEGKNA